MTELISSEKLKSKFIEIYSPEVIKETVEDKIILEIEGKKFTLEFDTEELNLELAGVKKVGSYYTISEETVSFLLRDTAKKFPCSEEESIVLNFMEGVQVKVKKDKRAFGLLINKLENVINISNIENEESYTLDQLIDDSLIVCELTFSDRIPIPEEEEEINRYRDSIRTQLSYKNNVYLESIIESRVSLDSKESKKDEIKLKLFNDEDALAYFLFAESVEHLHLKYLEYYHVLEYYFLHKRIQDVENVIKNLITLELVKKDDSKKKTYYKDLMNLFESYYQKEDKNTSESEQLEYIIKSDLGYDLIRELFKSFNIEFLKKGACEIAKTSVNLKDDKLYNRYLRECDDQELTDKFCAQLANRIYKVRNFIVHSKKYERSKLFTPTFKNLSSLKNEVSMIRILAHALLTKH
ncbi:hypothetical protein [Bacillus cereus]|uniref:hypothetical protein n=1 Tax=Bacillus cereus TaxID=1396 RepID=UPI001122070E|nr:hypothetical protein [Bacillus cereus]MCH5460919.1 hypothetical protein [Bacillus cereus]TNO60866.1 hypothetical protein FHR06_27445 [Bacillus cereus]